MRSATVELTYLNELRSVLARVRRRWLATRSMRATARAASAAVVVVLLLLLTDRFLRPADLLIAMLFLLAIVLAVIVLVRTYWPLRRSPTDRQVARYIEERCPSLEDGLASATDLAETAGSSVFRDRVVSDAVRRARDLDLDLVVPTAVVRRSVAAGVGATAALVLILILGFGSLGRIARTAWLYAFPYTASLRVEPGDARVVAGEPVRLRATLEAGVGTAIRSAPVVVMTTDDGDEQLVRMSPDGDGYAMEVEAVERSFGYRVRMASVVSEGYEITALFPPAVRQIDVAYRYPPSMGLAPRVEPDGGDIYAPRGTEVTVSVRMTTAIVRGALEMAGGHPIGLTAIDDLTLQGTFEIREDDTYRVRAFDRDGLVSDHELDYFIRLVEDHPPTVEIVRPQGDREITALEEVAIEARAEDDFGLEQFELVYSVVGGRERSVSLVGEARVAAVTGRHTIFAEELDLRPGDVISYYARARDTSVGATSGETRSDIYFLQVRPFGREFEEAQSQSGSGMQAADLRRLAEVQKQIIVATWKLDGRPVGERSDGDLETVADAQGDLRLTARMLAARMGRPTPAVDPTGGESPESDALRLAVEAMGAAETALRGARTDTAIPAEMTAFNQLLTAQAEAGRTQVSQNRSQGGGGAGPGATEDLSALFDDELRRDQQTSYEDRASAEKDDGGEAETDLERRLRQLAERQQELAEEQRDLASRVPELEAEALTRHLERLTRDQEELRREMADLERELDRRQGGQRQAETPSGATGSAGEQMRRALGELRRGDLEQAASRAEAALDSLRDLQREMGTGRAERQAQAVGQLRLEAEQVAESQRQVANEARQPGVGSDSSIRRQLAERETTLAERVESLADRLDEVRPNVPASDRDPLDSAAEALEQEEVADAMRELAETLRDGPRGVPSAEGETDPPSDDRRVIQETSARLTDVMNRVAAELAAAEGRPGDDPSDDASQTSRSRERAQALADRLEAIEQQLSEMARTAAAHESTPVGAASSVAAGQRATLQAELRQQIDENPELMEQLRRDRPALEQDLQEWARQWQTGAAPATEAFKQDLSKWTTLYAELRVALEELELTPSRGAAEAARRARPLLGPTSSVPERYRHLVDEYYRSLASGRD